MDVKKMIEKLIDEIQKDGKIGTQFKNDPVKVIENIIGKDLPDDVVDKIVDGVKAKISLDKAANALDKLDDMFDKVDKDKLDDALDKVDLKKAGEVMDKAGDVADALKKLF